MKLNYLLIAILLLLINRLLNKSNILANIDEDMFYLTSDMKSFSNVNELYIESNWP